MGWIVGSLLEGSEAKAGMRLGSKLVVLYEWTELPYLSNGESDERRGDGLNV